MIESLSLSERLIQKCLEEAIHEAEARDKVEHLTICGRRRRTLTRRRR